MTKEELCAKLRDLAESDDPEAAHAKADKLLCQYIGDVEVSEAFLSITRWYA